MYTSNKKVDDEDATSTFISSITSVREIKAPFEVKRRERRDLRTADVYEIEYNPETDAKHPYEKWRRKRIYKCLITREIARYLDRRTFLAVSLREALIHCVFLVLIAIVTIKSVPIETYYYSQAISKLYIGQEFKVGRNNKMKFADINTFADIYTYTLSIIDVLYMNYWYTERVPYERPDRIERYRFENTLIGMPRLRQIRVNNNTCEIHSSMQHLTQTCYGEYTLANEDKGDMKRNSMGPFWVYKSAATTKSRPYTGSITTYGGGGYVAVLQKISDRPRQIIAQLIENRWISRGTRVMFIEFTIYNANINLFCIFKVVFEIPASGGVIPSHSSHVQKLLRYNNSSDYVILFWEIICVLILLFYTFQKLMEFLTLRTKLLCSFWNWIDIIVLITGYMVVIFDILLYVVVYSELPDLASGENEMKYPSFDGMCYIHSLFSYTFAIFVAFAFFRLVKYLNIIFVTDQLKSAISRSTGDILSYCVMFFYMYFVFALVGLFLFGSTHEGYNTFLTAVFTLLKFTFGDFNYEKLLQADPICGPIFFFAFIFFITFIFVNIFLAILVSRYEEVRSEVRIGGAKTYIGDMLCSWFLQVLEKARCTWVLSQLERKRFETKVRSPTEGIRQYLRQAGYAELEIELFFKKYDITDSKISAMDGNNISYTGGEREAPPPLSREDIKLYIVIQKLEYLEKQYEAANKLIDAFLDKLTKFEARR